MISPSSFHTDSLLREISDEKKNEFIDKAMFRYNENGKEYYRFKPQDGVNCYEGQLTFLAQFVIFELHIWESSLTVRLSNPHMRK